MGSACEWVLGTGAAIDAGDGRGLGSRLWHCVGRVVSFHGAHEIASPIHEREEERGGRGRLFKWGNIGSRGGSCRNPLRTRRLELTFEKPART